MAKKYPPIKFLPDDPENKHLSKKDAVAKFRAMREADAIGEAAKQKALAEMRKSKKSGDKPAPADDKEDKKQQKAKESKEAKIGALETELKEAIAEYEDAEAEAETPEENRDAEKLKKKVSEIKRKLTLAKKGK